MRIIPFVISITVTGILIFVLNSRWGSIPALGQFLSPQQGFWQNAEPLDLDRNESFSFPQLEGRAAVYLDERLVPHIFADNDHDAYFIQGFIHAKYRLWQMDFNSRAAAGRLSEILGSKTELLKYDRQQRRLGMVYAAENFLQAVNEDPEIRHTYDAYTAGVNAYINTLTESTLPLEFKLLGYKPEPWNNLKICLFAKLMASDLAGQHFSRDMAFTNLRNVFTLEDLSVLFPQVPDSLDPIVFRGTVFPAPSVIPQPPVSADSVYFKKDTSVQPVVVEDQLELRGSNNWAVGGSRTASGAPILSNDPHLRLTLPSIWFEMQIHTPQMNVYGATFASAPGVIIGFNDDIAWGVTNGERDVMDYYQVRFRDQSKDAYWFNGRWQPTQLRIEQINIKGATPYFDTVAYTIFGPVMYDDNFNNGDSTSTTALAVKWVAHEKVNDGRVWYQLNRAKNYDDYAAAVSTFNSPSQNFVFASRTGDIAIWHQGRFPAYWPGQGLYIMPGEDSSYLWQGYIPTDENPHLLNPSEGFVFSANQRPVDSTYPYFIPGNYPNPRGRALYRLLTPMQQITTADMMQLQNNNYHILAADAVPLLLSHTDENVLDDAEKSILNEVKKWDFFAHADSRAMTVYQVWMDSLQRQVFDDEFSNANPPVTYPDEQTFVEILLRDSAFRLIDNIHTPEVETLNEMVTLSLKKAVAAFKTKPADDLLWWKHRTLSIQHLLRDALPAFGRTHLKVGGWRHTLNAVTKTNGPSWRMIVHLAETTEAYGVYPGGQSGNPGSRYYDNFIDTWKDGKYYLLWIMTDSDRSDKRIIGTIQFSKV